MKNKSSVLILLTLSAILILSIFCNATGSQKGNMFWVDIPAPSLQGNLLEDPHLQRAYIYLPPSYNTNLQKRYPVVYFLHGQGDTPMRLGWFQRSLDSLIINGQINEAIWVAVNGDNKLCGSFYVNSIVTGKWEDYVINDVVKYIDENYRTIANSASRGIAGFSMGGFSALNLSFKHPDVFSVVFSLSPGLFDQNGLTDAMNSGQWDSTFMNAYGAAFSPNPQLPYPYAEIPKFDGSPDDNTIKANWESGFGNLSGKIDAYLSLNKPLTAIRIAYGESDMYVWIRNGCEYFSKLLTAKSIQHDLLTFKGGHNIIMSVLEEYMFPFFSEKLKYQ